jgi:hypothetical protein
MVGLGQPPSLRSPPFQLGESRLKKVFATSGLFGPGPTNLAPDGRVEAFNLAGLLGLKPARLSILALDGFVHLLAVY